MTSRFPCGWKAACAAVFGLGITCGDTAHGQAPTRPTALPTAVISSGAPNHISEASPSAWTADRNPLVGGLRPNASAPAAASSTRLPDAHPTSLAAGPTASVAVRPAVETAAGTAAAGSSAAGSSAAGAHIPLAPPSPRFQGESPESASSPLQMFVSVGSSLLLVLGAFLAVAWCYRKTLSGSAAGGLPKQVLQVMGRTPVSPRQQMVLVRFGSKLLLVSVVQGETRTLSEISDPLEVDRLLGLCESGQPGSITQSFKNVLLHEGGR